MNNKSAATSGGSPEACPPTDQNFLNFMQFLAHLYAGAPILKGCRPLLREILDPPLATDTLKMHKRQSKPFSHKILVVDIEYNELATHEFIMQIKQRNEFFMMVKPVVHVTC